MGEGCCCRAAAVSSVLQQAGFIYPYLREWGWGVVFICWILEVPDARNWSGRPLVLQLVPLQLRRRLLLLRLLWS